MRLYQPPALQFKEQVTRLFRQAIAQGSALTREVHQVGYRIPWASHKRPKLTSPQAGSFQGRQAGRTNPILSQKWQELVAKGHARVVSDSSKGLYSPSFVIPKKGKNEFRLINDLRHLNTFVLPTASKMPGIRQALAGLHRGDWLASFDVENGYYNVNIHPADQKYFRFRIGDVTFELLKLPMGFRNSNTAFRAFLQPYLETLRYLFPNATFFAYVDDVLISMNRRRTPKAMAEALLQRIQAAIQFMKLPLKATKSCFTPKRHAIFLGFKVSSHTLTITIPAEKLKSVRRQVIRTMRQNERHQLQLRHLSSTIGQLMALLPAVPEARLHSGYLHRTQATIVSITGWIPHTAIHLDTEAKAELNWWILFLKCQRPRPLQAKWKYHELSVVATDASQHTLGGVLLSDPRLPTFQTPLSRRRRALHINIKEFMAVEQALLVFDVQVRGTLVNIRSDSMVVVHGINRWGCAQQGANPILRRIFQWTLETGSQLTATYINTHANTIADKLSRNRRVSQADKAEAHMFSHGIRTAQCRGLHWVLSPRTRRVLPRNTPPASTNISSIHLAQTPRMQTAFPHLNRVQKVLDLIMAAKLKKINLIVPLWPQASWFRLLAGLSTAPPQLLQPSAIRPAGQLHHSIPSWNWILIQLSGDLKRRRRFRQTLASRNASGNPRCNHTTPRGERYGPLHKRTLKYLDMLRALAMKAKF